MNWEVAVYGEVPLGTPETSEGIPWQVALAQRKSGIWVNRRASECRWIESFSARAGGSQYGNTLRRREVEGLSLYHVGPDIRKGSIKKAEECRVKRGNRSSGTS